MTGLHPVTAVVALCGAIGIGVGLFVYAVTLGVVNFVRMVRRSYRDRRRLRFKRGLL